MPIKTGLRLPDFGAAAMGATAGVPDGASVAGRSGVSEVRRATVSSAR